MTTDSLNECRAAFERWNTSRGISNEMDPDNWGRPRYKHSHVDAMWEGFYMAWMCREPRVFDSSRLREDFIKAGVIYAGDCPSGSRIGSTEAEVHGHAGSNPASPAPIPHCPECGYTKEDALIHWDHHLCKGEIPGYDKKEKSA